MAVRRINTYLKRMLSGTSRYQCGAWFSIGLATFGCAHDHTVWRKTVGNDTAYVDRIASQVDNPTPEVISRTNYSVKPVTVKNIDYSIAQHRNISLSDCLQQGFAHSVVIRDLGATVLRSPETARTNLLSQINETDPRFSPEAALSQFDATLDASASFNNNDRLFNNAFFAGGTNAFVQDLHNYSLEVAKKSATGAEIAFRGVTDYDSNNAPANIFGGSFQSWLEGEVRQPLLQGGGLEFNRVAGPNATPGLYNGVLIAKTNLDIENTEFRDSLRRYVSNVENAYWDLYAAYRVLDARKKAMERALVIWNEIEAQGSTQTANRAQEALARQQYYRLKTEVDNAMSGDLTDGTETGNGSDGGTMQSNGGVLAAERRLRLLVGLPAADGTLLRPSDEPTMAEIGYSWDQAVSEALVNRPELQKTHLRIKRREMELVASKNFLNPRLDAIARYRFRGFGKNFIDHSGSQSGTTSESSVGNLFGGDHQEWMLGLEVSTPIGFRQAHLAVNNAELQLARERAIQGEQEREIISNLNGAFADIDRAYQAVQNNLNRYLAAKEYFDALLSQRDNGLTVESDRLLDAQERLVRSEVDFFRSRASYAVALKNVHFEKGSLLDYKNMRIAGEDPAESYYPPAPVLADEIPIAIEAPAEPEPVGDVPVDDVPINDTPLDEVSIEADDLQPALPEFNESDFAPIRSDSFGINDESFEQAAPGNDETLVAPELSTNTEVQFDFGNGPTRTEAEAVESAAESEPAPAFDFTLFDNSAGTKASAQSPFEGSQANVGSDGNRAAAAPAAAPEWALDTPSGAEAANPFAQQPTFSSLEFGQSANAGDANEWAAEGTTEREVEAVAIPSVEVPPIERAPGLFFDLSGEFESGIKRSQSEERPSVIVPTSASTESTARESVSISLDRLQD